MSYENAPATRLLATHCACCGRPLVDAASVEAGIGPECRRKHGYGEAQGEPDWTAAALALVPDVGAGWLQVSYQGDARAACNALVHRVAVTGEKPDYQIAAIAAIRALGYATLARKLAEHALGLVEVLPSAQPERLTVRTPFDAAFVVALKAARIGARWEKVEKVWSIPSDQRARAALWSALRDHFAGRMLVSETGMRVIDAPARRAA